MSGFLWDLDLSAERELAGESGDLSPRARAARDAARAFLVTRLLGPQDRWLDDGAGDARGRAGVAWCPTPRALARLHAAGARPLPAPDVDVLARVNARPFLVELDARLGLDPQLVERQPRLVARSFEEVRARIEDTSVRDWVARRPLGAAGRGRRFLRAGELDAADRAWVAGSLARGPLCLEARVVVVAELALHGFLRPDGELLVGEPCLQEVAPDGSWRGTRRLSPEDDLAAPARRLRDTFERVGQVLHDAGYHGPWNLDARLGRTSDGELGLRTAGDLNARFSMGFAEGFGAQRLWPVLEGLRT